MTRHARQSARDSDRRSVTSEFVQSALSGSGTALPDETRAALEPLFGHSFADVRVFDDARAHEATASLHAKAFTVGQDIAFNADRFAPHTAEGQRLLMHELSHTMQQGSGRALPRSLEVSRRGDAAEGDANAAVSSASRGVTPSVRASTAPSVQLEGEEETAPPPIAPVAPNFNLDLLRLQASGVTPLGQGSLAGQASLEDGAAFQLKQPNFNVSGGVRDWTKPYLDANGKIGDLSLQGHYDPSQGPSAAAQYPFKDGGGLNAQVNSSGIHAQGSYGAFNGNANYGAGGFDARLNYGTDATKAWVGTEGAGVQTQLGQFGLGASTDFESFRANGSYTGNVLGQNLMLGVGAGGNLDGSGLNATARGTWLQPGGLPIAPWAQIKAGENGVQPSAGLGVKWE
jgi:Domain of unknown function (DUF4157)